MENLNICIYIYTKDIETRDYKICRNIQNISQVKLSI